jgi:hypothetical protein
MMMKSACAAAFAVASVTALGCSSSSQPTGVASGALNTRWTIAGSSDPNQCAVHDAANIDIRVFDPNGGLVSNVVLPCQQLAARVFLYPGRYTGTMTLTNSAAGARTTTLVLQPFDVFENTDTFVPVDFPADSFL